MVSNADELQFMKAISHSIRNYRIPRYGPGGNNSNKSTTVSETVISYGGVNTTMKAIRQSWLNFLIVMAINSVPGWTEGCNYIEALPIDEEATNHWDAFEHVCEVIGMTLANVLFRNQTSVKFKMISTPLPPQQHQDNTSNPNLFNTTPPLDQKKNDYLLDFVHARKAAERVDDWDDVHSNVIRLPSSSGIT